MLEIVEVFRSGSVPEIIAQIIGVFALAASVASFQMKTYRRIMLAQIICAALFAIHLGMLFLLGHRNAISGCVGNIVCLIRNVIFQIASTRQEKRPWLKTVIFSILVAASILLTWQSPFTLFCLVGLVLNTVSFSMTDPQKVRRVILVSSPFIFVYNLFSASVGGAVNELISITSVIIGLIRFRKGKVQEA